MIWIPCERLLETNYLINSNEKRNSNSNRCMEKMPKFVSSFVGRRLLIEKLLVERLLVEDYWSKDYWSKRLLVEKDKLVEIFLKENSRFSHSEFRKIPCLTPILSWVTVLQKIIWKKSNIKYKLTYRDQLTPG